MGNVKNKGIRVSESKSKVYAWLSIVVPGMRVGRAFTEFKTDKLELDNRNYKSLKTGLRPFAGDPIFCEFF